MKTLKSIFAALVILTFAANANAQYDASDEATATAVIIAPIAINKVTDLAFGNIIASADPGTVTVDLANGRTRADGATFPSIDGTVTSAEFTVTGFSGALFTLTLPADGVVKLSGDGTEMELTDFTSNEPETIEGGSVTFQVGATLNVNADQDAGTYTGAFDAIVNYN